MNTLLAVDIGNTGITAGLFRGTRLIKRFSTPTHQAGYRSFLYSVARSDVTAVIIASVVPHATEKLVKNLKTAFPGIQPVILGKNASAPVKNRYKNPGQVGQDRLVNAFAAIRLYGCPAIVVDFGTAITFDIISAKGEYKGGLILPGLQTSLDALAEKTALLPKVSASRPSGLIGRDTRSSMLNGIIYGSTCMADGLARKLAAQTGKQTRIIGTGGHIKLIAPYCTCFTTIDPDLTLKGLNLINSVSDTN